jgi:hypothetical protein
VLADVSREFAEFRVLLNEPLHVIDGLYIGAVLGFGLVMLYILLDVAAEVSEIQKHIFLEEGVLILG